MTPYVPDKILSSLQRLYSEPHRHYHTWAHVEDMLALSQQYRHLIIDHRLFDVAILFHDAVYDPKRHDNEGKSALLVQSLENVLSLGEIGWVQDLIMATMDHKPAMISDDARSDARVLVDIDLSILGREPKVFWEYEANIRKEYAFVPVEDYRTGRAAVLQGFLDRDSIYFNAEFQQAYEEKARTNLRASIDRLTPPT